VGQRAAVVTERVERERDRSPGSSSDGGYTNILVEEAGSWKLRRAASDVSAFYAAMNG
jgi:hypothetical protein